MSTNSKSWTKTRKQEGFFSADPLPSEDELLKFYSEQYYQQSVSASYQAEYSEQELAYKSLQARLFMYAIGAKANQGNGLLEVGCGEGFFLAEAKRQHWPIAGIDFSGYAVEKFHPDLRPAVEIGDAFTILARFAKDGRRFDACALQNVLEHVIDPHRLLDRVKSVLAPGAKILITLPNDYSRLQQMTLQTGAVDHEYWFMPPQHLHYFDIEAASVLLRSQGYRVVDVFADFPIEIFLLHPGSNYVRSRDAGPAAHRARMAVSLLCAESGLQDYLELCRSYARCGIGRAFTLVATLDEQGR